MCGLGVVPAGYGEQTLKILGAHTCVGFDISANALKEATELAKVARVECTFVKSDAQRLPDEYANIFDIVLITAGALCFIPDIDRYFSQARKILKCGGQLFIFESHPVLKMFDMDRDRDGVAVLRNDYFTEEPQCHKTGLDYYTHQTHDALPIYYFHHKLSDIVNAAIKANLTLRVMEELSFDPSLAFGFDAFGDTRPPMGLVLIFST